MRVSVLNARLDRVSAGVTADQSVDCHGHAINQIDGVDQSAFDPRFHPPTPKSARIRNAKNRMT